MMKTFTLLTTAFLISMGTFAQNWNGSSTLVLHSTDNAGIAIQLDNGAISSIGTQVRVDNLTAGVHQLIVYKMNYNYGWGNQVSQAWSGSLNVPSNMMMTATLDQWNRLMVNNQSFTNNYNNNNNNTGWGWNNGSGTNVSWNTNWTNGYGWGWWNTNTGNNNGWNNGNNGNNGWNNGNNGNNGWNNGNNGNNGWNNGNNGNNGWNNGNNGNNGWNNGNNGWNNGNNGNNGYFMNDGDFNALLTTISNTSFESSKKDVAMAGIRNNTLSALQIKTILQTFSFESTKLEVAKFAYDRSTDKQNFFKVLDVFSFDSSKTELTSYMR